MSDRIEVGYVCYKGSGHVSLAGEVDHGACGSHIAGHIYIELDGNWWPGNKPDIQNLADEMKQWVTDASTALEKTYWDEGQS